MLESKIIHKCTRATFRNDGYYCDDCCKKVTFSQGGSGGVSQMKSNELKNELCRFEKLVNVLCDLQNETETTNRIPVKGYIDENGKSVVTEWEDGDMTQTTKYLAEKALCYIEFHHTKYGVGFSFDAAKYAKEVLEPAMNKVKTRFHGGLALCLRNLKPQLKNALTILLSK